MFNSKLFHDPRFPAGLPLRGDRGDRVAARVAGDRAVRASRGPGGSLLDHKVSLGHQNGSH